MVNRKWTNNDLQNITQKTKDRVTQTPLQTRVNSGAPEDNCNSYVERFIYAPATKSRGAY
jgi:hypothetical protein